MIHFRWLGHLSTINVMPGLVKLKPATWKGVEERCEIDDPRLPSHSVLLRCHKQADLSRESWLEDLPVYDWPAFEGWTSMQKLLSVARKTIAKDPVIAPHLDFEAPAARAMLTAMPKLSTMIWHKDDAAYHKNHLRFHLPLTTNPAALSYIGPESCHMPVGSLWWFNNAATHCSCNWGDTTRIHLIFEIRKKQAASSAGDL